MPSSNSIPRPIKEGDVITIWTKYDAEINTFSITLMNEESNLIALKIQFYIKSGRVTISWYSYSLKRTDSASYYLASMYADIVFVLDIIFKNLEVDILINGLSAYKVDVDYTPYKINVVKLNTVDHVSWLNIRMPEKDLLSGW